MLKWGVPGGWGADLWEEGSVEAIKTRTQIYDYIQIKHLRLCSSRSVTQNVTENVANSNSS